MAGASTLQTAVIDTGNNDADVEAWVYVKAQDALAVRVTDRHTLIGARLNVATGQAELFKRDAGVVTVLASTPFKPVVGRRYGVRIIITGAQVDATFEVAVSLSHLLTTEEQAKYTSQFTTSRS